MPETLNRTCGACIDSQQEYVAAMIDMIAEIVSPVQLAAISERVDTIKAIGRGAHGLRRILALRLAAENMRGSTMEIDGELLARAIDQAKQWNISLGEFVSDAIRQHIA